MPHLATAGLQLELANQDNLDLVLDEIRLAKTRFPWLELIVLPELSTYGPSTDNVQPQGGDAEQAYRAVARELGVWLIPGSVFMRDGDLVRNTAPVIDPDGSVVARYHKQFPWMPYERGVAGDDQFCVFDIPGKGRVGLAICYDMWFPEIIRTLAWMGAEAVIIPTMTSTIDRGVELAIARAQAAMNQVWLMNVNVAGRLGYGQSIVVGPDGTVLHQSGTTREFVTVECDFAHVRRVRERGLQGLCQTLKSFRDAGRTYPPYEPGARSEALDRLGPLGMPEQNS